MTPSSTTRPSPRRAAASPPPWWASQFDRHYLHEYEPIFQLEEDRHQVSRLIAVLALPVGARILDCPCGQGRHAHLLAEAGYDVDGVDLSKPLLDVARKRGTARTLRYRQGDMRRLPAHWSGRFNAVLNLFTSFGFFTDPADDARVIAQFARVLRPGGMLVWHGGSRDGVMARFLARDWWTTRDGTVFAQERTFDPLSGVLTVRSTWRGPRRVGSGEREHRIRLYTASRVAQLCADAGLVVREAFDAWRGRPLRRTSSEMLLVAVKE